MKNIVERSESERVTFHYLGLLDQIRARGLDTELSVKLTQLGLDLDPGLCYENLRQIEDRAGENRMVWIDMEASNYVDATLDLYRRARQAYPNVGICLQAYLYRTSSDLESLIPLGAAIRLVKGAYMEPANLAFPAKKDVDENYFTLAQQIISEQARAAFATHDRRLIQRIIRLSKSHGLDKHSLEFQMLYGIQRAEQHRLTREGWKTIVLIAYGSFWFPWYMRRLAERPANAWFVARNLFSA